MPIIIKNNPILSLTPVSIKAEMKEQRVIQRRAESHAIKKLKILLLKREGVLYLYKRSNT